MLKKRLFAFTELLKQSSEKGMLLLAASFLALCMANTTFVAYYLDIISYEFYIFGDFYSAKAIVNDFLMTFFFFVVGAEIRREMSPGGSLASKEQKMLPVIAACAGVIVPVIIYCFFNYTDPTTMRGWAIPAATDIAFALGVLALVGKGLPASLKIFLTALAIIDDLIAVLIIALFYTSNISSYFLSMALVISGLVWCLNFLRSTSKFPYAALGFALWYAFVKSGIHPSVSGVLFAFLLPISNKHDNHDILKSFEKFLNPYIAYIVLPLFAFINSGITFGDIQNIAFFNPVVLGVAVGLFIGKQLGIFSTSYYLIITKRVKIPTGATFAELYGISIICGIGFTMSLFVGNLAFNNSNENMNLIKMGVLFGSLISAVVGAFFIAIIKKRH